MSPTRLSKPQCMQSWPVPSRSCTSCQWNSPPTSSGTDTYEVFCDHQQSETQPSAWPPLSPPEQDSRIRGRSSSAETLIVNGDVRWLVWSSEGLHTGGSPGPRVVRTARQVQEPESTRSWSDFPPAVSRQLVPSLGVCVGCWAQTQPLSRQPDRHALSPTNATLAKLGDNGREPACFCF